MAGKELENLAGLLTPEGNQAVERCPICGRLNSPGACDRCQHFFGSDWDGDIIWSDQFDKFEDAWGGLQELMSDLAESTRKPLNKLGKTGLEKASKIASKKGIKCEFLKLDPVEESAASALRELVEFSKGRTIVTDGMASGSGYSLYLEEPAIVDRLTERIVEFEKLVRAELDD